MGRKSFPFFINMNQIMTQNFDTMIQSSETNDFLTNSVFYTSNDPKLISNDPKLVVSQFVDNTNKNGFWKYEEDKTLKEIEEYLTSTYHSHYTSENSKTQTLDLIESIGDAEPFTRSNAIKYLSRFGKKNGKSKMDILKAIHYCILLYHFAGLHSNKTDQYQY